MKMNFKKTLSLILAVLMVMTAIPLSGMATDAPCDHANAEINVISKTADGKFRHYITCSCGLDERQFCDGPDATSCGEAKKCTICKQVIGAALDHTFAPGAENATTLKEVGANCQTGNTYFETCTVCGAPSSDRVFTSTTNAGPHHWDEGTKTYSNCDANGVITYKCQNAPCTAEKTEAISPRGHDFTKRVETDKYLVPGSVATCSKGAEFYYACNNEGCEAIGTAKYNGEEKGDHTFRDDHNTKHMIAETCSKDAEYYMLCTSCDKHADELPGCGDKKTVDVGSKHDKPTTAAGVIKPEENFESLLENPTCLDNARYYLVCAKCEEPMTTSIKEPGLIEGVHFYEKSGTALNPGHYDTSKMKIDPNRTGKTATCVRAAEPTVYVCTVSGCEGETVIYPENALFDASGKSIPLGHVWDESKTTAFAEPACKTYGANASKYCTSCSTTYYFDKEGKPATGAGKVNPLGCVDDDKDEICDRCLAFASYEETCTCICHNNTGIMYFVVFILKFFWKLSGSNPYCPAPCGKAHY